MITDCKNNDCSNNDCMNDDFMTPGHVPSGLRSGFRSTTFFRLVGLPSRIRRVAWAA